MSLNGILIISTECKSECRPRAQALNPALGPLSWPSHLWSRQLCQGAGAGSPGPGPGSSPGLAHTCTMFASACLQWALEDRQGRDRPPGLRGPAENGTPWSRDACRCTWPAEGPQPAAASPGWPLVSLRSYGDPIRGWHCKSTARLVAVGHPGAGLLSFPGWPLFLAWGEGGVPASPHLPSQHKARKALPGRGNS